LLRRWPLESDPIRLPRVIASANRPQALTAPIVEAEEVMAIEAAA
jgi:hypothetical protein